MNRFGFMATGSYEGLSVEAVCDSLVRCGYTSVEWPLGRMCPRGHSAGELRAVVQATRDCGLEISEVVVQQDYVVLEESARRDAIAYTVECIQAFGELGIKTVNVFTGPRPWLPEPVALDKAIARGTAWDMVLDAYQTIVPEAERCGVVLALENVWGMVCRDFFTARYLVDKISSPALGVNYDPSHDILAGNLDVGWIVRQWGGKIKHVHLKDAVGLGHAGQFVFPLLGEGRVDWRAFFGALAAIGYEGVCSVEFESFDYLANILENDMEAAARLSMETINTYFRRLT